MWTPSINAVRAIRQINHQSVSFLAADLRIASKASLAAATNPPPDAASPRGCGCGSINLGIGAIRLIGVGATQLRSPVLGPKRVPTPTAHRIRSGWPPGRERGAIMLSVTNPHPGCRFTTRVRLRLRTMNHRAGFSAAAMCVLARRAPAVRPIGAATGEERKPCGIGVVSVRHRGGGLVERDLPIASAFGGDHRCDLHP
jgi:hypothetical protein